MEIEFNPSRISQSESSPSTARRNAVPVASDSVSFASSTSLKDQLNQIPAVRPEKVQWAQAMINGGKYPPDDVLDRIAILLAIHTQSGQAVQ